MSSFHGTRPLYSLCRLQNAYQEHNHVGVTTVAVRGAVLTPQPLT